jgi:hypothetical protein
VSVFTGWWAERAGRAEQDADRLAELVGHLLARHGHAMTTTERDRSQDCLRDWKGNRERRYRALPAGHTLEGNLTSGGITR